MPFKIVQTLENKKPKLTIVPSYWESNGLLRIPLLGVKKLMTNGDSRPFPGWINMKCTLKRVLPTYKKAEEELDLMEIQSDPDSLEHEAAVNILATDYNAIADNLLLAHQHEEEETPGSYQNTSAAVSTNEQSSTEPQNIQIDTNILEEILKNQSKILENQKEMLQTQSIMQETQKCMLDKIDKNARRITDLAVLVEDCFARISRHKQKSTVPSLGDTNNLEKESFIVKPLTTVQELEELELLLTDHTEKRKFEQRFEFLCSKTDGNGINCAYKLVDILFSRELLCKCSWSGGSRGTETKIALKGFKNFLGLFYGMIHSWDQEYTNEDNEKFFKVVLKNSAKRLEMKNLRASTKRRRKVKNLSNEKKEKTETKENPENIDQVNDKESTKIMHSESEIVVGKFVI